MQKNRTECLPSKSAARNMLVKSSTVASLEDYKKEIGSEYGQQTIVLDV
jgi:hypothetical protein